MHEKLFSFLESRTRVLEILYLIHDLKPCVRIAIRKGQIPKVTSNLYGINLKTALSDFSVSMQFSGSYSTKGHLRSGTGSPADYMFLYIAKDNKTADYAKDFEAKQDIKNLGKTLGYPVCCIDFFKSNKKNEEEAFNDYVVPMLANSKGQVHEVIMNIFTRYFDYPLLSHAPCSLDCIPSKKSAQSRYKLLKDHYPILYNEYNMLARTAAVYKDGEVILIPYTHITQIKDRIQIKFDKIMCYENSSLGLMFMNNSEAEIFPSKLRIGNMYKDCYSIAYTEDRIV